MDFGMILSIIVVIALVELCILGAVNDLDFSIFSSIRNYENWYGLEWVEVVFFTIILNIVFAPFAIFYWLYKFLTK